MDEKIESLLQAIYGTVPDVLCQGISRLLEQSCPPDPSDGVSASLWDEQDVVLITYADQVQSDDITPLVAQTQWLLDHQLDEVLSTVHLLPFCPYTSDDGFSVVDYLAVDPDSGSWDDIAQMGQSFSLMYDLVLNHASQKHQWFERYLADDPQYADFFIDIDPDEDLSKVVRPRALDLLTPFESPSGTKHVWTTFSPDQVDLNYANPHVMLAMIEILVQYALRGARIIRLDAIAFLWKQIGTDCLHLPQTHASVQLMRRVLDLAIPGTLVLTETNVPHTENISYFGSGDDEAHMVYQFSLPPLLLDAIHSGDTSVLRDWLAGLSLPSDQTTFFNFTASHDGIGVRPLEGIVPDERVERLAEVVCQHGGRVNMRTGPDGRDRPYELNITYLEAVADRTKVSAAEHAKRFLASQAVMLSMRGMPAIYFHSLVGSLNDHEGVEASGQNRRINRHKYHRQELDQLLAEPDALHRQVFDGYRHLLEVRCQQKAFHPTAIQTVLPLDGDGLLGFIREFDSQQAIAVLANLTDQPRTIPRESVERSLRYDELADELLEATDDIAMQPFQVRWLGKVPLVSESDAASESDDPH